MYAPINREKQVITQRFTGVTDRDHRGVDLRCVKDGTSTNLEVTATEKSGLLRQGRDRFGNFYVVLKPLETPGYTELKYVHINNTYHAKGKIFEAGEFIGWCIVGGNSKSLHLHFETWNGKIPLDPQAYFKVRGTEYGFKGVTT
jgi:murein DD-endopeptidase MepM/ murein hydrolase activator NlpD